jgi:large subunit ribosomal protein L17
MFRNMVTSLLKHDRIQTTDAKAKELRRWADHIITLAKKGDLHARRQALSIVREKDVVHKLFEEAPKRFESVSGGYTRIIKIGRRPGDAAPVSLIELITPEKKKKKTSKKTKAATSKKAAPKKKSEKKVKAAPDTKVAEAETIDGAETQAPEAVAEKKAAPKQAKAAQVKTEASAASTDAEPEADVPKEKKPAKKEPDKKE